MARIISFLTNGSRFCEIYKKLTPHPALSSGREGKGEGTELLAENFQI
jgi:hypothetical protein